MSGTSLSSFPLPLASPFAFFSSFFSGSVERTGMVDACGSLSLPAAMMAGVYLDVFDVLCAVRCEGLAGSTVLGVGICEGCFAMRSWIESRQSALDP